MCVVGASAAGLVVVAAAGQAIQTHFLVCGDGDKLEFQLVYCRLQLKGVVFLIFVRFFFIKFT